LVSRYFLLKSNYRTSFCGNDPLVLKLCTLV
jgi:hypothetical protein